MEASTTLTPEQEYLLEEEGEPSVYDDLLGVVVEQGRFVVQLISCLAEASFTEPDTTPEPNLNHNTLEFFQDGGLYNFLVEEPNACHVREEPVEEAPLPTIVSSEILPSKREQSAILPDPGIFLVEEVKQAVKEYPAEPKPEEEIPEAGAGDRRRKRKKQNRIDDPLNIPKDQHQKCCPYCTIV